MGTRLGRNVNEFIQICISFFERSSYKLRCDTVLISIVLCCCHQVCCLLYYLAEINSGIHMYQFTLFSDVVVVSDLNKNSSGSADLAKKRHRDGSPIHTPLFNSYITTILS